MEMLPVSNWFRVALVIGIRIKRRTVKKSKKDKHVSEQIRIEAIQTKDLIKLQMLLIAIRTSN